MLKFQVFEDGKTPERWPIRNAYMIGPDGSALKGSVTFKDRAVVCEKREPGTASLVLQQPLGDCGELTIQTCHLPERDEPYILSLELARHRLMTLYSKLEDWGMFDLATDHPVSRRAELARKLFIEALCLQGDNPVKADKLARDSLAAAVDGSEELAIAHAELLLTRRKVTGALPRYMMGSGVPLDQTHDRMRAALQANFDFVCVPTHWKSLAPEEGDYRWALLDNWIEWSAKARMPVVAGPLVCFEPSVLPDWLFIWEHDYDTVRDVIYEHVENMVTRYRNTVSGWIIVSGLHVNNHFTFTFEQLIDLTRMTAMLVKKVQPLARVIVELKQPYGEYYATNPRSITPKMYVDLLLQSGVNFDALSVKLAMGQALPGQYTRDLMQVSTLLDDLAQSGKSMYVSFAAPSEQVTPEMIAIPNAAEPADPNCGFWRKPWSQIVQAKWMEAAFEIALSKPYVESLIWGEFMDHPQIDLPLSGLVNDDMQPKQAYRKVGAFRRWLQALGNQPPATSSDK